MNHATWPARILMLLVAILIVVAIRRAQSGTEYRIRRIAGLSAIEEAVGRAIEMGRSVLLSTGLGGVDVITLQAVAICTSIARQVARFGGKVKLPIYTAALFPLVEESVGQVYADAGRSDAFEASDMPFFAGQQFAYAAGVSGLIHREKPAATFYFGMFYAESLILAENAMQVGAIQVAGTPSTTQIPFFIAACDYVIIGDEYYAATAYITRQPTLLGSIVGQDRVKMLLLILVFVGVILALFGIPLVSNLMGKEDLPFAAYFAAAGGKK
ncbi:MAG: hypothetical protein QM758_29360 [Armatimonas sp.]